MGDLAGWDDELGRELRQRVGGELRAEAEETERLAALQARRRATLTDVARHARARGDRLALDLPGVRATGTVLHAAGDLLSLEVRGGRLDVRTDRVLALRVVEPGAPGAGREPIDGPASFRARLFELEMAATPVEVVVGDAADPRRGVLCAVAVDHVALRDPDRVEWCLPLHAVSCVRS